MTIDELLAEIATLLWDEHNQRWNARARGSTVFCRGATPREAMERAVGVYKDVPADVLAWLGMEVKS